MGLEQNGTYVFNVDFTQRGSFAPGDGGVKMALKDGARTVAKASYDYASHGAKDRENNYLYDAAVRTRRVAAVSSLVVHNHAQASIVSAYNRINFGSAECKQYMNEIGLGTVNRDNLDLFKQNVCFEGIRTNDSGKEEITYMKAEDYSARIGFKDKTTDSGVDFYSKLTTQSNQFTQKVGENDFSFIKTNYVIEAKRDVLSSPSSPIAGLPSNLYLKKEDILRGYFMHDDKKVSLQGWTTASGHSLTDSRVVNVLGNGDIGSLYMAAQKEQDRTTQVVGAFSTKDKLYAMNKINDASMEYIRSVSPELRSMLDKAMMGKGNDRASQRIAIVQVKASIRAQLETKNLSMERRLELHKMKSLLEKHDRFGGGGIVKNSASLKSMHRQGMRVIGDQFLGQDMMKGINFYDRAYRMTKHSVKAVSHISSAAITYGIEGGSALAEMVAKKAGKNNVADFMAKGKRFARDRRSKNKERARARRGGKKTWKEFKKSEKLLKGNKKIDKLNQKIVKLDDIIKKGGKQARLAAIRKKAAEKALAKLKKKIEKMTRKAVWETIKGAVTTAINSVQLFHDIAHVVNLISGAVGNVTAVISAVILAIKAALIAICISIVMAIFCYEMIIGLAIMLVVLITKLFSLPATDLVGALDNRNFNQYIVDDTCQTLGGEFIKTAKNDAKLHYLLSSPEKSPYVGVDGISWKKDVVDGGIGHIWAREESDNTTREGGKLYYPSYKQNTASRKELSGVNANMVPIISMMNQRFEEDINFDNYHNAMAYAYYMYVVSHNISSFDSNGEAYEYKELDPCEQKNLYNGNVSWDPKTKSLSRPEEICPNIFVHGYMGSLSDDANKKKAKAGDFLRGILEELGADVDTTVGTVKMTADGNIPDDHYMQSCGSKLYFQYSTGQDGIKCGKEEHIHSPGCYSCSLNHHVHKQNQTQQCWSCTHECTDTPDVCYSMFGSVQVNHCAHGHNDACKGTLTCTKTSGSHETLNQSDIPAGDTQLIKKGKCEFNLTCSKEYHEHISWKSKTNPGCYYTVAVCSGHCGEHIEPVVNVVVTASWEGLMREDVFKQTYWMSDSEFSPGLVRSWIPDPTDASLVAWKNYWTGRMAMWYVPFPRGPINLIQSITNDVIYQTAKKVDEITNGMDPERVDPEGEDLYGFEGWWEGDNRLNQGYVKDFENLFGTYKDGYEIGVANWEDVDVVFPVGPNKSYSEADITDILESLMQEYPELSEEKQAVVAEAVRGAGKYWYQNSPTANQNGCKNKTGASDSAGFVAGVFNRVGKTNLTSSDDSIWHRYSASGKTNYQPGTVLVKKWVSPLKFIGIKKENISVIYLGFWENPTNHKSGHWIVECSHDTGGSTLKTITTYDLSKYDYYHNYY